MKQENPTVCKKLLFNSYNMHTYATTLNKKTLNFALCNSLLYNIGGCLYLENRGSIRGSNRAVEIEK